MVELLKCWDQQLFFFLNGLHTEWLDTFMYWYTNKRVWAPFYLILLLWIVKEYKWRSIVFIIAVIAAVGLSDLIISGFMKPFFERYRPSRNPDYGHLVHIVNDYRGGRFGFASSHAGTAFALATYIFLLFRKHYKWIALIFIWATIMAYTRVYLGVHYPGDLLTGAVIGTTLGYWFYKLSLSVEGRFTSS